MNLPNWLFASFLIFVYFAPWNVYPVKCGAYFSGAPFLALLNAFVYGVKYLLDPYSDYDLSVHRISSVFDPYLLHFLI